MTSKRTAIWNLLKRERRSALPALLGQGLLLLAACGGDAGVSADAMTGTAPGASPSTTPTANSSTTASNTGAAGQPATMAPKGMTATTTGSSTTPTTTTTTPATTTPADMQATPADMGGADMAADGSDTSTGGDVTTPDGTGDTGDVTTPSGDGDTPLTGESSCLADVSSYDSEGPFEYETMRAGSINFWVPKVPDGCKVPIIHLANGTGASCSSYNAPLVRFATHGFLTCCYENPNTGAGTQGLEALQTALDMFPNIAAHRFGSTGHSQGGQAAFVVQALAEKEFGLDGNVFAGLAMQPASGFGTQPQGSWQSQYMSIKSPMFMFSGRGSDGLVPQTWVQDAFDALDKSIEAYHWTKQGGTHIPVPSGEEMQIGPAWFRWKLLGDKKACEYFKAIPMSDNTWEEVSVQNAASCD